MMPENIIVWKDMEKYRLRQILRRHFTDGVNS